MNQKKKKKRDEQVHLKKKTRVAYELGFVPIVPTL
jgi:hypothetical protein